MITDATPKEVSSLEERTEEFLRRENATYRRYRARRSAAAVIAKGHGLTNQQIADAYGITEAAVRGLIKRAK